MKNYKERYQRKNFISLCLSDEELSKVEEMTKRLNTTRAAAVRDLLLLSTTKLKNKISNQDNNEYLFLLSNISNNINQIAKKMNSNINYFLSGNGEQFAYLFNDLLEDIEKIKRSVKENDT
ncbi:plasmid mobilization relaxosome protein MobC [Moellerella wisconsensis]|uniref:plasmid mobilization relaxosome protein MobC n=1 Tax=Moellerella wisconsensis TaxID=158849 RepID=UPI0006415535|nr:plasmid mobilization relaxosome protein MobC [Moellerella wisconsensis]KLN96345.1 hypothetical protein VK86_10525 [Moellerella wisconsensis]